MRLALDTNLISHRTPRELLHGVAIEREFPLVVLPEVLEETLVRVRKVEERRVDRLLAEDARWNDERMEEFRTAAGRAALDWWLEEIEHSETAYVRVEETVSDARAARRIASNLPSGIVERAPPEPEGDALIIAQAIVYGAHLLSTNNLQSIDHENANRWARSMTQSEGELIQAPDNTLRSLADGDRTQICRWAIGYGGANRMQGGESRWRRDCDRMVSALKGAGFDRTSGWLSWALRTSQEPSVLIKEALRATQAPGRLAWASEQRRYSKVRGAMMELGWHPKDGGEPRSDRSSPSP